MTGREVCERLKAANIENFMGEAKILAEHFSSDFSLDSEYSLPELIGAVEKRCEGYPLQYIIGKWWFARCEFEVNENCLVPRSDTESVVEIAQKLLPAGARFADLCTGSGCIAIALLDLRRDLFADAYELYPETLEIAKRNAVRNSVDDRFEGILGDVLEVSLLGERKYSAIISNPPYIRTDVIDTLSSEVRHEPRAALDGGEDGMMFYRAIVENFSKNLMPDGRFIFEIGYDQGEDIKNIADANGFSCRIVKDLGGCDRVAILERINK